MIAALSRQSDLNLYTVQMLHNLTLELTRLNLEVQELRARLQQTDASLEELRKRERALESLAVLKDDTKPAS
jgi:prefoldin subunit 5